MGADKRVPVAAVDYLNPGHVDLNQRRSAPLARLQENQAYRFAGETLPLKGSQYTLLGAVELKSDIRPRNLVAYPYATPRPVFKVVDKPQPLEAAGVERNAPLRVVDHRLGKEETAARYHSLDSVADTPATGGGVMNCVFHSIV